MKKRGNAKTPLEWAAILGRLPVVQYPRKQGADKEANDDNDKKPQGKSAKDAYEFEYI